VLSGDSGNPKRVYLRLIASISEQFHTVVQNASFQFQSLGVTSPPGSLRTKMVERRELKGVTLKAVRSNAKDERYHPRKLSDRATCQQLRSVQAYSLILRGTCSADMALKEEFYRIHSEMSRP